MVDFVVPVLADNPLAYCPGLISLYMVAKVQHRYQDFFNGVIKATSIEVAI